jgi:hypothetical protein
VLLETKNMSPSFRLLSEYALVKFGYFGSPTIRIPHLPLETNSTAKSPSCTYVEKYARDVPPILGPSLIPAPIYN